MYSIKCIYPGASINTLPTNRIIASSNGTRHVIEDIEKVHSLERKASFYLSFKRYLSWTNERLFPYTPFRAKPTSPFVGQISDDIFDVCGILFANTFPFVLSTKKGSIGIAN